MSLDIQFSKSQNTRTTSAEGQPQLLSTPNQPHPSKTPKHPHDAGVKLCVVGYSEVHLHFSWHYIWWGLASDCSKFWFETLVSCQTCMKTGPSHTFKWIQLLTEQGASTGGSDKNDALLLTKNFTSGSNFATMQTDVIQQGAVLASCEILSHSILNLCAEFRCLITLLTHGSVRHTGLEQHATPCVVLTQDWLQSESPLKKLLLCGSNFWTWKFILDLRNSTLTKKILPQGSLTSFQLHIVVFTQY